MTIEKKQEGTSLMVQLGGRLDTTTAPELEAVLKELGDVKELLLDFENLE